MFQNTRKRGYRRGWPIMGYVGSNGGGKSAAMVWDTMPSLAAGRRVLSTVRLLDWANPRSCPGCDDEGHTRPVFGHPFAIQELADESFGGDVTAVPVPLVAELLAELGMTYGELDRPVLGETTHAAAHPLYEKLHSWGQLLEAKSADVLLDEVTGVASSRESQSMPAPVANKLVQLRRADVVVRWSAPAWARADKIIRECSQAVTFCTGRMPVRSADDGLDRQWRQRRLFSWKTYDAADFEDFTAGKREQLNKLQGDLHWGPKSPVFRAYDTFDAVSTVGTVSDAGRCYQCGGSRAVPKCSCADYERPRTRASRAAGGAPEAAQPLGVPEGSTPEPGGRRRLTLAD